MKNITIAIDDETYRAARVHAAERGTSVSALVKMFLGDLAAGDVEPQEPKVPLGVREMQTGFTAAPAAGPAAAPWTVQGKPVWTTDGKPRQPGALRTMLVCASGADDLATWPVDMLASFDTWDESAFDPLP